jgi:parallel beta-helix repeat protein
MKGTILWTGILWLLWATALEAATIKVDPRGGGDFLRLQQAINSASVGDVILVSPGTYDEQLIVDKQVRILGIDPVVCKVVYSGSGTAIVFRNGSQNAQVMRLSITSLSGNGILCEAGSHPTIKNNVVAGNGGEGIRVDNTSATVLNNTIMSNRNNGIYIEGEYTSSNTIAGNIIASNLNDGVRWYEVLQTPAIDYNNVWGNGRYGYSKGQYSDRPSTPSSDISMNPQFVNATGGDYRLQPTSPCINAGWDSSVYADLDGSRNDMGAYGGPDAPSPGPMVTELEIQPQSVPQGQPIIIRATGVAR